MILRYRNQMTGLRVERLKAESGSGRQSWGHPRLQC